MPLSNGTTRDENGGASAGARREATGCRAVRRIERLGYQVTLQPAS